ncbi:hypothetical protein F5880DRAFT_979655 [Lentinula raphanica]|nr:hypothetical protein F5880DRAFT_979655 [Lentinula raphanica]
MSNPDRQNSSSSQEKRSLSEQLSSIGARINRALSTGRGRSTERPAREFDNESLAISRGRQGPRHSSGRGGIGNIVSSSVPEDVAVEHSSSPIRGRETARPSGLPTGTPFSSSGRGGVGNIRAPSQEQFDSDAITLVPTRSSDTPSFGRSPSQTSPPRNVLSTGRGGIGNIKRNPTSDSNSHSHATDNAEQNARD